MVKDTGRSSRESSLARGWTVEGEAERADSEASSLAGEASAVSQNPTGEGSGEHAVTPTGAVDADDTDVPHLSGGAMALLGIIGGVYLLYTVVWFSWAGAYANRSAVFAESSGSLGSILEVAIVWIAPIAPAAWLFTLLLQLRDMRFSRVMLWLIVGLVVLLPLPLLIAPGVYTGGQ